MDSFRKVLIIDNDNESLQLVIDHALTVKDSSDTEFHFLSCKPQEVPFISEASPDRHKQFFHERKEERVNYLVQLAEEHIPATHRVEIHDLWTHPPMEAIELACELIKPDLLVKLSDPNHYSEFFHSRTLDYKLIKSCPTALMLVRKDEFGDKKVLAAIDGGTQDNVKCELNENILEWAESIAGSFGSLPSLISAHMTPILDPAESYQNKTLRRYRQKVVEEQHENIQSLVKHRHFHLKDRHIVEGYIEDRINELVEKENYRLVVLGNHRNRGLRGHFVANTAERLMERGKSDLLLVPY
ncbi:universal stress protein [Aliikangiella sp. G2MR2-5]|uniref:universal stress protein n=1 Tax=Aliikangiella sp. G2MR2-5 TaxID=2788943 RepID=UPI0018AAD72B|nr:universal stress protein [Aliikangiella sp. G2MR2-5]